MASAMSTAWDDGEPDAPDAPDDRQGSRVAAPVHSSALFRAGGSSAPAEEAPRLALGHYARRKAHFVP